MNKILLVLFFAVNIHCLAQTQIEMNREKNSEYTMADAELNKIYKQILIEYKSDETFIQNLKKSQRLWIKFRNAELEMMYPKYDDGNYGSILSSCKTMYLAELTKKETKP